MHSSGKSVECGNIIRISSHSLLADPDFDLECENVHRTVQQVSGQPSDVVFILNHPGVTHVNKG